MPEPTHIVGEWQYWLDRLGLKVPRALCGVSLGIDDPTGDGELPTGPVCRACAAKARWTPDQIATHDRANA